MMRASGDLGSTADELAWTGASLSPFLSADNFLVVRPRTSWNMVEDLRFDGLGEFQIVSGQLVAVLDCEFGDASEVEL